MAREGREETTQEAPPVDQPTDESPALTFDSGPQVVEGTAVEEPVEQQPPVRAAEEEVAPTAAAAEPPPPGPEPSFEPSGGTSPREADREAASQDPGHPEYEVLAAFAGAFVFAQILKRLGGGGDG